MKNEPHTSQETAYLGGGCFWCIEAVYERIDGVIDAESGYAGGHTDNPGYEEVCSGTTGHAEVVKVTFDPSVITFSEILDIFWKAHNPTTPDRQGADVGTQYRSIILTVDEEQQKTALKSAKKAKKIFRDPIVTQIIPLETFYPAEEYHQDYFRRNPYAGYCRAVIAPKLKKLKKD